MKLISIVGARPQFIKAAVVSRAIETENLENGGNKITEILVHTGQHYDTDMSDIFFKEMRIPKPGYHLKINNLSHGAMTGRMLEKLEKVLQSEKPDAVLVYGDTNSTLAGALAAAKLHIPVAHVEAGLRSFNWEMPEEINRVVTDRVSRWLFCPTESAARNLANEGIGTSFYSNVYTPCVLNVGDVMYDASVFYRRIAQKSKMLKKVLEETGNVFYLATVHRAENTDNLHRLQNIITALNTIARKLPVILPLHPRTRKIMKKHKIQADSIRIIDPVSYLDMIILLDLCRAVFTDSGGLQKEAFFFSKPCFTLRNETEWVELVEHGCNKLTGAERERILEAEENISALQADFSVPLYGNGNAGQKIIRTLLDEPSELADSPRYRRRRFIKEPKTNFPG